MMSAKQRVKLIRKIVKKKCPTVSVRMGRGTVYGWAEITSRDIGASFTKKEYKCLKKLGLQPASNWDSLDRTRQKKFIEYHMMKRAGIPLTGE